MDLSGKTLHIIQKYSMLQHGDRVLIGLSGGPDSVCLSIILDELKDNFNLSLYALYVNHGLRPEESERERSFCNQFCDARSIRFHAEAVPTQEYAAERRLSIQEAARVLRYRALEKTADTIQAGRIAVGHTADDQTETVLMRLIRGAGRKGLSGIPPVRDRIIRPLIGIKRVEIESFLTGNDISSLSDPSNYQHNYTRNRIRLEILPLLRKENRSIVETVNRVAEVLRAEDAFLQTITNKAMMRIITRKTDQSIELSLVPLLTIDIAILRRVIRRAVSETGCGRSVELSHIDTVIRLIKTGKSGDSIQLPHGVRAVRSYSTVRITREKVVGLESRTLTVPGDTLFPQNGMRVTAELSDRPVSSLGRDTALCDYDSLTQPLQVRKRREGDYFYPAGFGKRKKLQDFFVDEKVPREARDTVPVIVSGDEVVWIAGYRMDERFVAKEETRRYLLLRLLTD